MSHICKRFQDSLCHIAKALTDMPRIFGINTAANKKGDFPHAFNTIEHQNYIGPIPALHYYAADRKKPDVRREMVSWWDGVDKEALWDFQKELVDYCMQDTRILAKCLEVYYQEGMAGTGISPLRSVTIASYAMKVFKSNYMEEGSIAVLTPEEESFGRASLRGGRTDMRRPYASYTREQLAAGIGARYVDVQSLYPYVQFRKPMPVGPPTTTTYTRDAQPTTGFVMSFIGVIECDVDVCAYMFHPILVARDPTSGKLEANLQNKVRMTFTSIELQRALLYRNDEGEHVYHLKHVYRIMAFQSSTEVFRNYLRYFLTLKIQNSGLPSSITSDEDWHAYDIIQRDEWGLILDKEAMVANKGKKELAKLMLNSLWGKFAQREHGRVSEKVDGHAYNAFLAREDRGEVTLLRREPLGQDGSQCIIDYREEECHSVLAQTNVVLASFVSAWGRLVLWEEMNKLGDRILYHDTDSIIYEANPQGYNTPEGCFLGDWECETEGVLIREFISTGPKTYGYRLAGRPDSEAIVKCKGFTLNYANSQALNFDTLRSLFHGSLAKIITQEFKMLYNRNEGTMYAVNNIPKVLRYSYNKGQLVHGKIYPYGAERFTDLEML